VNKNKNFLDYIPMHSSKITWSEKEDIVVVDMYHKGFFPWIVQKLFYKPKVSHVKLDKIGSFIWKRIDGERTINDLANELKSKYGDKIEPLYDRLIHYIKILYNNKFIIYKKRR